MHSRRLTLLFWAKLVTPLLLAWVSSPLVAATVTADLSLVSPLPVGVNEIRLENLAGSVRVHSGSGFRVNAVVVADGADLRAASTLAETVGLAAFKSGDIFNVQVQYPVARYRSFRFTPLPTSTWYMSGPRTRCFLSVCVNRLQVQYQGERVYLYRGTDRGVPIHVDLDVAVPPGVTVSLINYLGPVNAKDLQNNLHIKMENGEITVSDLTGNLTTSSGSGDTRANGVTGKIQAITDSGDIHLRGVHSELITINTDSGDVYAQSITGNFQATTDSGDVRVSGLHGDLATRCDSGDVFAKLVTGNFNAKADSGNIHVNGLSGDLRASSDSGDVYAEGVTGGFRVNDDSGAIQAWDLTGPSVFIRDESGDVVIRGVRGSLQAVTDSGDVDLYGYHVGASVSVRTSGGSVLLQGDAAALRNLSIHTDSGGVLLLFPGTLSMRLEATSRGGLIRVVKSTNMHNAVSRHEFFRADFGRSQGRGVISTNDGNIGISGL